MSFLREILKNKDNYYFFILRIAIFLIGILNFFIISNSINIESFGQYSYMMIVITFMILILSFGFPNYLPIILSKTNYSSTNYIAFKQKKLILFVFLILFLINYITNSNYNIILPVVLLNILLYINACIFLSHRLRKESIIFGPFRPMGSLLTNIFLLLILGYFYMNKLLINIDVIFSAILISSIGTYFLSEIFFLKTFPFKNSNELDLKLISMLKSSIPIGIQRVFDNFHLLIFTVIASQTLSPKELGLFFFSHRIILIILMFKEFIENYYTPIVTDEIIKNKSKNLDKIINKKTLITLLTIIPSSIFIIIFYDQIISIFSPQYLDSKSILYVFIPSVFLSYIFKDYLVPAEVFNKSNIILAIRLIVFIIICSIPFIPGFYKGIFLFPILFSLKDILIRILLTTTIRKKISNLKYLVNFNL